VNFILTIDTEGDNQWEHGRAITVENIKFVPRFQELCNKYSIKPTYLVTSEVCEDKFARDIFTEYISTGNAEIGSHLHAWTTPPFIDKDGYRYNDSYHVFASELPGDILKEKIKNLTTHIESSFGKKPTSFRSGRYGFNETVADALIDNGYLIDSSVTPYINWKTHKGMPDGIGGPDFINNKPFPYQFQNLNGSLVEIPITILPTRFPLNMNSTLAKYYFKNVDNVIFLRILRKLYLSKQPLWLRPFSWMTDGMIEELVNEAVSIKLPYLVMMFHSSELMPGCSIYRKDKNAIEKLYELLEACFNLLLARNIKSITLTEAATLIRL
jgi:hypothetical protein